MSPQQSMSMNELNLCISAYNSTTTYNNY